MTALSPLAIGRMYATSWPSGRDHAYSRACRPATCVAADMFGRPNRVTSPGGASPGTAAERRSAPAASVAPFAANRLVAPFRANKPQTGARTECHGGAYVIASGPARVV